MTRRVYETLEDRQREDWVMGKIAKSMGLRFRRSQKFSSYDGELAQGPLLQTIALIEIKCRTTNKNDHTHLIVTKKKIDAGMKIAAGRGLDYMLGVRWMDVIAWMRIETTVDFEVSTAGRTDRNDKKDMEPCYMIPVQGFTDLSSERK